MTLEKATKAFRDPAIRAEWRAILECPAWAAACAVVEATVATELKSLPPGTNPIVVDQSFFRHQGALRALSILETAADEIRPPAELPEPYAHYAKSPAND